MIGAKFKQESTLPLTDMRDADAKHMLNISYRIIWYPIPWILLIKYIGVYIVSSRKLSFDITSVKQAFLLPVTLICAHLRVLMRRCIYPSKKAIVFLF